jgi:hypothetical protein
MYVCVCLLVGLCECVVTVGWICDDCGQLKVNVICWVFQSVISFSCVIVCVGINPSESSLPGWLIRWPLP